MPASKVMCRLVQVCSFRAAFQGSVSPPTASRAAALMSGRSLWTRALGLSSSGVGAEVSRVPGRPERVICSTTRRGVWDTTCWLAEAKSGHPSSAPGFLVISSVTASSSRACGRRMLETATVFS